MSRIQVHSCTLGIILLLWSSAIMAGITGKITGVVRDKATGQVLPGVNITIDGQPLGAASDLEGYYLILQVPPGRYMLRFSMVGYQEMVIRNVRVSADLTTRIDAQLEEQALELDEAIVITADRPVIQKDITSSTQFVGAQELLQLPVSEAKEGLMLQTGVFFDQLPVIGGLNSAGRGEKRYSVRGGSQEEVKWYVDGVRTSSLVAGRADWGGSFTNVNMNAIEEAQVITGGFNAEYGEAQSGIVNIITKEGGLNWSGSFDYQYGLPGQHHFGNYIYDRNTQKEFIDHTLDDGTLDPQWWTDYRRRQIYDYRRIPDHLLDVSLGGYLFKLQNRPVKFFFAGQFKQQAYTLPHPRDARRGWNGLLNLSWQVRPNLKVRINGLYNLDEHSTLQENGDFTQQAKYYRGWGSVIDTRTDKWSLDLSHTLSDRLFYDLKLSYFMVDFDEGPGKYSVLGKSETRTIWGFHRYDNLIDEPYDKYAQIIKNKIVSGDISAVGSISWQADQANLVKSGFELRYNTVDERATRRFTAFNTDPDLWINRGLDEKYNPLQFAFYVQDKMEFESMILNVGLRYDYFDPNRDWFKPSHYFNLAIDAQFDPALDADGDQVDENGHVKYSFDNILNQPREKAKAYHMLAPRLGVSFPVTDQTLLHFNYGHFYQMPPLDRMFELFYFRPVYIVENIIAEREAAAREGREPRHIPSADGDPERVVSYTVQPLTPQKTIMFEVGLKQNFGDLAVLDITAYYKDVSDQTVERIGLFDRSVYGYDPFRDRITPNIAYAAFFPGDYGDSRGFEITFRTLFSRWFTFDLNYSFSKAMQGRATPAVALIDADGSTNYRWDTDVNKRIPIEKTYSRPHIFRANLFMNYPDDLTGTFADDLFRETTASFLYRYISGQAFTYLAPDDPPDTYDNYRYPGIQTVDLRLEKMISLGQKHHFSLFARITNLFNRKNLRSIGDRYYFNPNDILGQYVKEGKVAMVDLAGYDISWQTWYDKRRVYVGVKYFF